MKHSILVIDDEEILLKAVDRYLRSCGYNVQAFSDWQKAWEVFQKQSFDLLLVDLMLPQTSGVEVIRRFKKAKPDLIAIVMTGFGTIPSAIEAIRSGAYHYVTKPFDLEDLGSLVEKALEHVRLKEENQQLKRQLKDKYDFENFIGKSAAIKSVFQLVEKVADTDSTLLIRGESGTGKEILARAIHFRSRRASKPFVAVNCSAIPEGLLESELFGHVRGAFTGAIQNRAGRFEVADSGTIFLDEIGDMSPKLQVKVLRVLQDRLVDPVGSTSGREVDVRIIAATHQDLEKGVAENRFREDLYYRLNVISIRIPPLRDRREDIPLLIDHFLEKENRENKKKVTGISKEVMEQLLRYRWPGNVRELENLVEKLVVLKGEGSIEAQDLPALVGERGDSLFFGELSLPPEGIDLKSVIQGLESDLIRKALGMSGGNKNKAAQLLHLNRTTLIEKMRKWSAESHAKISHPDR